MTQTASTAASLPTYTYAEIADQLVYDYWNWDGHNWHRFEPTDGKTIYVDTSNLTADGQRLAQAALGIWQSVTPLVFVEDAARAVITFDDVGGGASASFSYSGNRTNSAHINISTSWLNSYGTDYDSYSMQTYLHEIGHALGLGHSGFYDGNASFSNDAHFANDSWQATLMSYFDQVENDYVNADKAYVITPMAADLLAVETLYGPASVNLGATIYGANSNVGGYLQDLFDDAFAPGAVFKPNYAFTIKDTGGRDTLNLAYEHADQRIDLTPGATSDIAGLTGNMVIAVGTFIEWATGGFGDDRITGNDAGNRLLGGDGNDNLAGMSRADFLDGGSGNDTLSGNGGPDKLKGRGGDDTLFGGAGDDKLAGNAGDDVLVGGSGADQFDFNSGNDLVRDFVNDQDTLALDDKLWVGVLSASDVVAQFADDAGASVRFTFSANDILVVENIDDAAVLIDDIIFI